MYNRQSCLPIDVKYIDRLDGDDCSPVYDKEVLKKALEMKRRIEEKAITNIVCLQKKQKIDYDRKHATVINILLVRKYSYNKILKEMIVKVRK